MQAYTALGYNTVINRAESVEMRMISCVNSRSTLFAWFYHLILTTYFGPITLCMNEAGNNMCWNLNVIRYLKFIHTSLMI